MLENLLPRVALWPVILALYLVPVATARSQEQDERKIDPPLEQAVAAQEAGDYDAAERLLRDARDAAESDRDLARASAALGRLLVFLEVTGEGMALLYQAFDLVPEAEHGIPLIDALLAERDRYLAGGEPHNAASSLQRAEDALAALGEIGDDPQLLLRKARILWRGNDRKAEAVRILEDLLGQEPENALLHEDYITAVGEAGAFEEAFDFYETLPVERSLQYWFRGQVHVVRAHHHFNRYLDDEQVLKDYREAERLVLESARVNPDYVESATENAAYHRAWIGWTLLRGDRLEEARDAFVSSLGRQPGNKSAIEGLAQVGNEYNDRGELEEARELFRVACLWAPERADFWNNYGLFCRDTGQYEEAFLAYHRALQIDGSDPRTLNDTALMLQYHLHRDLDQAERWLLEARELAREGWINAGDELTRDDQLLVYGDALVNLWRLYDDQGRMQDACAMVGELREVDPGREELPPVASAGD